MEKNLETKSSSKSKSKIIPNPILQSHSNINIKLKLIPDKLVKSNKTTTKRKETNKAISNSSLSKSISKKHINSNELNEKHNDLNISTIDLKTNKSNISSENSLIKVDINNITSSFKSSNKKDNSNKLSLTMKESKTRNVRFTEKPYSSKIKHTKSGLLISSNTNINNSNYNKNEDLYFSTINSKNQVSNKNFSNNIDFYLYNKNNKSYYLTNDSNSKLRNMSFGISQKHSNQGVTSNIHSSSLRKTGQLSLHRNNNNVKSEFTDSSKLKKNSVDRLLLSIESMIFDCNNNNKKQRESNTENVYHNKDEESQKEVEEKGKNEDNKEKIVNNEEIKVKSNVTNKPSSNNNSRNNIFNLNINRNNSSSKNSRTVINKFNNKDYSFCLNNSLFSNKNNHISKNLNSQSNITALSKYSAFNKSNKLKIKASIPSSFKTIKTNISNSISNIKSNVNNNNVNINNLNKDISSNSLVSITNSNMTKTNKNNLSNNNFLNNKNINNNRQVKVNNSSTSLRKLKMNFNLNSKNHKNSYKSNDILEISAFNSTKNKSMIYKRNMSYHQIKRPKQNDFFYEGSKTSREKRNYSVNYFNSEHNRETKAFSCFTEYDKNTNCKYINNTRLVYLSIQKQENFEIKNEYSSFCYLKKTEIKENNYESKRKVSEDKHYIKTNKDNCDCEGDNLKNDDKNGFAYKYDLYINIKNTDLVNEQNSKDIIELIRYYNIKASDILNLSNKNKNMKSISKSKSKSKNLGKNKYKRKTQTNNNNKVVTSNKDLEKKDISNSKSIYNISSTNKTNSSLESNSNKDIRMTAKTNLKSQTIQKLTGKIKIKEDKIKDDDKSELNNNSNIYKNDLLLNFKGYYNFKDLLSLGLKLKKLFEFQQQENKRNLLEINVLNEKLDEIKLINTLLNKKIQYYNNENKAITQEKEQIEEVNLILKNRISEIDIRYEDSLSEYKKLLVNKELLIGQINVSMLVKV